MATPMREGQATSLKVHLKCGTATGIKEGAPSIPGAGVADAGALLNLISAQIKAMVTVADLEKSLK